MSRRLQQLPELLWSAAMIVGAAAVLIGAALVASAAATGRPDTTLVELTGLTVTIATGPAVATLPVAALVTLPRRRR